MPAIRSLLVANRGEVARRIFRTCRAEGVRTIAVYSRADADLPFVREADCAVCIGEGSATSSYLDVSTVLEAAKRAGADAVHPGYGFLAERASFAEDVVAAGMVWVGPSPAAIRTMGDKAAARRLAVSQGVPVLPGYDGEAQDLGTLTAEAERIGVPLLVKATAGGGGRGMRLVRSMDDLSAAVASARREALSAFGDDRVLLERYVSGTRHIEVQVLADAHGLVVHLGERECSIQRRHQKVVEEAPSPAVDEALRHRLGGAAVRLARSVGYEGVGTVEFILDPSGDFWFLEMNTRLQVEHPVTELITGLDLVALQLAVAEGEPLGMVQDDIELVGHAVEVRLYAEDPMRDYLPGTGRIVRLELPDGAGLRYDVGYAAGNVISPHYDALVAKLVAVAPDRRRATRRLQRALDEVWLPGPASNLPLLKQILSSPQWAAADLDTAFLDRAGLPRAPELNAHLGVLAATTFAWWQRTRRAPWASAVTPGWRLNGSASCSDRWSVFGQTFTSSWTAADHQTLSVTVAGEGGAKAWQIVVVECVGDVLIVQCDGVRERWRVATRDGGAVGDGSVVYAHLGRGRESMAQLLPRHPAGSSIADDPNAMAAPLPGNVVSVLVVKGDQVEEGQALVVVEAMKMEHTVRAGRSGCVEAVMVDVGESVEEGAVLVRLAVATAGTNDRDQVDG
ncbi:MAG: acetyl/propionyl-CoA carboxylase alpha subunit [Kiritimatiellia bacterium]|jgi:acetyl/propionyl-CoA carboxylase alpha subunit